MALGAVTLAVRAAKQEVLMGEHAAVALVTAADDEAEPLAAEELLVEEVSIDGMCGVY